MGMIQKLSSQSVSAFSACSAVIRHFEQISEAPDALKGRNLSGEGFAGSLLRQILFAVYKTAEEDDPRPGLDYLKQETPHYWDRRQTIIALLNYLSQKPSVAMVHWKKDVEAAHLLLGAVEGDGV